jgi:hypothetical protein
MTDHDLLSALRERSFPDAVSSDPLQSFDCEDDSTARARDTQLSSLLLEASRKAGSLDSLGELGRLLGARETKPNFIPSDTTSEGNAERSVTSDQTSRVVTLSNLAQGNFVRIWLDAGPDRRTALADDLKRLLKLLRDDPTSAGTPRSITPPIYTLGCGRLRANFRAPESPDESVVVLGIVRASDR